MEKNVKAYKPSGLENVEAMLVSEETAEDAANWCGGEVGADVKPGNPEDIFNYVLVPALSGAIKVWFGDYLIRDYRGRYTSMSAKIFEQKFTEIKYLR